MTTKLCKVIISKGFPHKRFVKDAPLFFTTRCYFLRDLKMKEDSELVAQLISDILVLHKVRFQMAIWLPCFLNSFLQARLVIILGCF